MRNLGNKGQLEAGANCEIHGITVIAGAGAKCEFSGLRPPASIYEFVRFVRFVQFLRFAWFLQNIVICMIGVMLYDLDDFYVLHDLLVVVDLWWDVLFIWFYVEGFSTVYVCVLYDLYDSCSLHHLHNVSNNSQKLWFGSYLLAWQQQWQHLL